MNTYNRKGKVKILSCVLAFVISISTINVGTLVHATTEVFEVSYDHPAILINENTKAELSQMTFQLSEGGDYVSGSAITWTTVENNSGLILSNSSKFVAAVSTGTYPICATYGEVSRIFYVVAKETSETDFYLINDDYTNGDVGDWLVFDGKTDVAFTKSDTVVSTSGGKITMNRTSDARAFLYNDDALLDFSDYTVEVDALCNISDGGFWHRFGIIGRSNADVSQNFSVLLRLGYGINFMNSSYMQSLFTADLKDEEQNSIAVNYHHFHTLTEEERAKLYPTSASGTGEYTLTSDTRSTYSVEYSGSDIVYSMNGNVIFDSENTKVADEWDARYLSSNIKVSLDNPYVTVEDSETWWSEQFSTKGVTTGGYAGILVNDGKVELYGFRVKLNEHDMAPATDFLSASVKELADGRTAVYLDTTQDAYVYTDDNEESYFTYESVKNALGVNPDIVYFVNGIISVWDVYDYSKALEIIGINEDRSKTIMSFATFTVGTYPYQNPVFSEDITFENMTFDVSGACEGDSQTAFESYMFYGSSNMVLDSVAIIPGSDGNGLQIGPVRNSQVEAGSLTVKGDTGPFHRISYSAANYWGTDTKYVNGDLTVNLESGTYNSAVGYTGQDSYGAINGSLFLNISGGVYNSTVSMLGAKTEACSSTKAVFKNAVARISGGVFGENGLGQTGATYISGREIYIVENHMLLNDTTLANGNPFYLTSEDTILIKVEDVASVGDAVYDENGVITAFAIVQREGYESYVNGEASETITVEAGGNYTINFRLKEDVAKQMLDVLVQDNSQTAEEYANTFDIRFVASLDDENNYQNAGFVFSLSNDMPCIDGAASVVRYTNKLYKSIMAAGTEQTVQEVYGSFSNYMFAFAITNVPEETTIYVRSFLTLPDNEVIYGEVREIVAPTSENTQAVRDYRSATEARITEIRNTTSDIVPADEATAYYFSNNGSSSNDGKSEDTPLATLEDLHALELQEGDVVYFERGSLWRGTIIAQTGVTYTSYGEGAKPMFYASPENGAEEDKWTEVQDNIWRYQTTIQGDVGGIVFDEGEHWGIKKVPVDDGNGVMVDNATREEFAGYEDLKNNYDFYYDLTDNQLYLYYDTGNPGTLFTSIEFCANASVIDLRANVDNVKIDNLCIKYTGQMGITSNSIYEGLSITNCEFGWIGGGLMYPGTSPTRYGNAIQIWGSAYNFVVDNCYFYQIYDAGVTWQYSNSEAIAKIADGVTISNNVMDYCTYSIEYFFSEGDIAECYMKNIEFSSNDMWFSGEGFGEQRPKSTAAHIKSWTHKNNIASDGYFNITDNIFAFSKENLLETYSVTGISPIYSGNVYIQYEDRKLGFTGGTSTRLDFTESNVQDVFGDENAKIYIIKK